MNEGRLSHAARLLATNALSIEQMHFTRGIRAATASLEPSGGTTGPTLQTIGRSETRLRCVWDRKGSAVLQILRNPASTPHDPLPMVPGEWNGNHNDRAFPMVGVPA